MRTRRCAAVFSVLAGAFISFTCSPGPPWAKTAAQVERLQCEAGRSESEQRQVVPLETMQVVGVEPLYAHILTGNSNAENRVGGVKIHVLPPADMSANELTRVLQCHSARALLGQIDSPRIPGDPFWLPGSWLDIDVKADDGEFAILLRADTVSNNLELLARANAFAVQGEYSF